MTTLCSACQNVYNENPIGALYRRDENGVYSMCYTCRNNIHKVNASIAEEGSCFSYVNPNVSALVSEHNEESRTVREQTSGVQAPVARSPRPKSKWVCPKCDREIFATPRAYEGLNEPEGWWWCKRCQALAPRKRISKSSTTALRQANNFNAQEKRSRTLDGWLHKR